MGGNQFFAFAKSGQIITAEELCVGVSDDESSVTLVSCSEHDSYQLWKYEVNVNSLFGFKCEYLNLFHFFIEQVAYSHKNRPLHVERHVKSFLESM